MTCSRPLCKLVVTAVVRLQHALIWKDLRPNGSRRSRMPSIRNCKRLQHHLGETPCLWDRRKLRPGEIRGFATLFPVQEAVTRHGFCHLTNNGACVTALPDRNPWRVPTTDPQINKQQVRCKRDTPTPLTAKLLQLIYRTWSLKCPGLYPFQEASTALKEKVGRNRDRLVRLFNFF